MRERQHTYELMFIISPLHSSDEEITATLNRVRQSITDSGGEVLTVNQTPPWGRRKLAFPIRAYAEGEASRRSFTEGYYILCLFQLPTTRITDVERIPKLTDAIMRYIITHVETRNQPSPTLTTLPTSTISALDAEETEGIDEYEDDEAEMDIIEE